MESAPSAGEGGSPHSDGRGRLAVRRPAPVAVPPRPGKQVEQVASPTSDESIDSPDSPDSPDSMAPESPSRIVVRNTFIDVCDETSSGSQEPGSPHRGNSAPASPTQRADPWDNVSFGEGEEAALGAAGFGKAPHPENLDHFVHFGNAQDGRWLRDLASPKKVSARPRKKGAGAAAEAEGTSSMRLGDLLKLGIPGQPASDKEEAETDLEKQMRELGVTQDQLLRSRLQPVLEGHMQADMPGGCLNGLGVPPAPAVSSTTGVWPGAGYRGALPGQPLLPNMEVPLVGVPPMPGAGGHQLPHDLEGACRPPFPGHLQGFPQANAFMGQDAGSRIPLHQDAGSRVPPQQVLWNQGLETPFPGGAGGFGGQNLPFNNLASNNFAGGLMAAGGMLLAQGISSLQQQQLQLQQQQEQLERLRQSIDPQNMQQFQACQAGVPYMPNGYQMDQGMRGNRQAGMKKGGGRAGNVGRGKKMEDDVMMPGPMMDLQAGMTPGAKEKAKVPLSGGGPKRTDYIKKFGGAADSSGGAGGGGSNAPVEGVPTTTQLITTMMLKNIPCRKSQEEVMLTIDEEGFEGRYDFFYLPRDVKFRANLGYAFINFITPEDAAEFQNKMDGYRFPNSGSAKACIVVPAHVQGALNNLQAFKRTEVMRSNRKPYFSSVVAL